MVSLRATSAPFRSSAGCGSYIFMRHQYHHPFRSGLVTVIERGTYGVPLVACGTHHGGEGGSVGGAGGEFVEDVAERAREDALDPSDLLEYTRPDQIIR